MEMQSEEFNSSLSSCYDGGKILVEDDGENGGGKGRVGEIIHGPAEDLTLLNGHIEVNDGGTRREDDGVKFFISVSPYLPISLSIIIRLS